MGLGFQASIQLFQWTVEGESFCCFFRQTFCPGRDSIKKAGQTCHRCEIFDMFKGGPLSLSPSRDNPANENVSTQSLSWAYFLQEIKTALER